MFNLNLFNPLRLFRRQPPKPSSSTNPISQRPATLRNNKELVELERQNKILLELRQSRQQRPYRSKKPKVRKQTSLNGR